MIDGQKIFNQPVKTNLRTHENIQKNATGQEDDYPTDCLLDCNYFNNYYKMMVVDLSKQQSLDVDPKAIQQVSFIGNITREENANTTMVFIIEEAKETILDFLKELWK